MSLIALVQKNLHIVAQMGIPTNVEFGDKRAYITGGFQGSAEEQTVKIEIREAKMRAGGQKIGMRVLVMGHKDLMTNALLPWRGERAEGSYYPFSIQGWVDVPVSKLTPEQVKAFTTHEDTKSEKAKWWLVVDEAAVAAGKAVGFHFGLELKSFTAGDGSTRTVFDMTNIGWSGFTYQGHGMGSGSELEEFQMPAPQELVAGGFGAVWAKINAAGIKPPAPKPRPVTPATSAPAPIAPPAPPVLATPAPTPKPLAPHQVPAAEFVMGVELTPMSDENVRQLQF